MIKNGLSDTGHEVSFEVKGLKELDEFLKTFPEKVQRSCIASATFAGAKVWRDAAQARAPRRTTYTFKGDKVYMGPMRMGGIGMGRLPGYLKQHVRVWKKRGREGGPTVTYGVGARGWAFYGRFLEFGTSKAQKYPWLRPAVDATTVQALEAMRSRLEQRIDRLILKRIKSAA